MALYETSENSCYSDFGAQDLRSSPLRVRARHLDVTVRLGGRAEGDALAAGARMYARRSKDSALLGLALQKTSRKTTHLDEM